MPVELLVAGDRRIIGIGDPGVYIDAGRVHRVIVGNRLWGSKPGGTWAIEVMTTEVQDLDADPPMLYSPTIYTLPERYPDEATAEREAERIRAFIAHGLTGIDTIAAERQVQIEAIEGMGVPGWFDPSSGEYLAAADCYLAAVHGPESSPCFDLDDYIEAHWPWPSYLWDPSDDPIVNLARAGAYLAADIDQRASAVLTGDN
mgnify:CR=1 FL=1